jgi:hypothetical protein
VKLPDALEQAVRVLLAPNGSTRDNARAEAVRDDQAEAAPGPVALRIEAVTTHQPPESAPPSPPASAEDQTGASDDLALVELERAAAVVERLGLGFHLGSAVERIAVAAGEGAEGAQRLREAAWLIERYLELLERRPLGADLHLTMMRLAREGDAIAGLQALANALERAPAPPAEPAPAAAPEEAHAPSDSSPLEHMVLLPQPSLGRELFMAVARAAIVVASIVGIVLALTLIAQFH